MFYWKEYTIATAAFVMLACTWHFIYVKPADEVRDKIYHCMVDIQDHSIQGYSFCRKTLNPENY